MLNVLENVLCSWRSDRSFVSKTNLRIFLSLGLVGFSIFKENKIFFFQVLNVKCDTEQ